MANTRSQFSDKSRWRATMRESLKRQSPEDRHSRSVRICKKLVPFFAGQKNLGLFAPTLTEPDLDLLWDLGPLRSHLVSYPKCEGDALSFYPVFSLSELISGRFGIRQSRPGPRPEQKALYGSRNRFASGLAINAAWLYPRSCSRCRCSGTGTTTSAANAFLSFLTTSASRSENHSPAARCARISRGESHKPARPHTRQDFERGQKRTSCHGRLDKAVARPSLAPTLPEAARKLGTLFHAREQTKRGSRRRWAAGSPL